MVFAILTLLTISFVVAFLVWKVQKNKAAKAESAEKCPYHNIQEDEDVVGYETVPPAPAVVTKKKPTTKKKTVTKKTAPKKANSSQKKK